MGKKLTVKEIELDKNLKSLMKKGLVVKIRGGYKITPLGMKLFGQEEGKPNGKTKSWRQKQKLGDQKQKFGDTN